MTALVDIYNRVLVELAGDLVAEPDQATTNAQILSARYEDVRDACLRAHPWNCALARQYLPPAGTPAFGYDYQYQLPNDPYCLRVLELPGIDDDVAWEVEGRMILTDQPGPLPLRFIKRVTDPNDFDALLVQAIVKRLASVCAWKLTKKERGEELLREYRAVIAEAKGVDGQEGNPLRTPFASTFLAARE